MEHKQREDWLNGCQYNEDGTLFNGGSVCVGCGKSLGVAYFEIPEGYSPPPLPSEWPFEEATCPLCTLRERDIVPAGSTPESLKDVPLGVLRQAIEMKKAELKKAE